jgi:hypothetical protein
VKGSEMVARTDRGYDAGNHAGRAVMPGWLVGWVLAQASGGERGDRPGITATLW